MPNDERRVPYAAAGRAMRSAVDRAVNLHLSLTDWRVLAAVLAETVSWSKVEAEISLRTLAQRAGLPNPMTKKAADRVAGSLRRLAAAGIVDYVPGGKRAGHTYVSRVTLPTDERAPDVRGLSGAEGSLAQGALPMNEGPRISVRKGPTFDSIRAPAAGGPFEKDEKNETRTRDDDARALDPGEAVAKAREIKERLRAREVSA